MSGRSSTSQQFMSWRRASLRASSLYVFRREAVGRGVGEVAGEDDGFGMGLAAPGGKAGKSGTLASQNRRGQRGSASSGSWT